MTHDDTQPCAYDWTFHVPRLSYRHSFLHYLVCIQRYICLEDGLNCHEIYPRDTIHPNAQRESSLEVSHLPSSGVSVQTYEAPLLLSCYPVVLRLS
jgi:hypothetical protein